MLHKFKGLIEIYFPIYWASKFAPVFLVFSIFYLPNAHAQEKYTISGYIKDQENGEELIGATLKIEEISGGIVSNVYGFYSITLNKGVYTLEYGYLGYETQLKVISLNSDQRIDIELGRSKKQLEEVVISARKRNSNVSNTEMSVSRLDSKTMSKLPALMGEVDVVKSIQLLPGVSSVGEGASGFNVRGGSIGQNLIVLDEAPVYNSSHLFGFFSVFNPDAVKDVKLYKGGIPSKYGGRLSSVLDVRMKEGNSKKFEANGGAGLIFSRLAIESPIVKDKASFLIAGRRSYVDLLAAPFLDNSSLFFYDLTTKVNYNLDENNKIFLSGYLGRDQFGFDENQGFSWGNQTATIRWNHLFSDKLFFNMTGFYSNYDYELGFEQSANNLFQLESHIQGYNLKPEMTYFWNSRNELSFGGNFLLYRFKPGEGLVESEGQESNVIVDEKKGLESAIYISNKQNLNEDWSLEYGLRLSNFKYLGDGTVYEFEDIEPGLRPNVASQYESDPWEVIENYTNLEPRFSIKYQMSERASIKGSYNRMAQYIHLLSNTTASIPLDNWIPSTNNLKPQLADQLAIGYFRNFQENNFESFVEVYYKSTDNQLDYIDGSDLLVNELIEAEVLSGIGRAYGIEFFAKKNNGKLNGWVSYTLSRTELKVDGINNGSWYPTRFDQTHNLKAVAFYELSKRVSLSANFSYTTGTPTTFPNSRYELQGYTIPHNDENARNDIRIPDFHRLDLSMTLKGREYKKGKKRKNEDYWTFSLYNAYNRKNAFSIYFSQDDLRNIEGVPSATNANQFSVIGSIVPAVSYNFKF